MTSFTDCSLTRHPYIYFGSGKARAGRPTRQVQLWSGFVPHNEVGSHKKAFQKNNAQLSWDGSIKGNFLYLQGIFQLIRSEDHLW